MAKTLFEKEYAISVIKSVENVPIKDPSDSTLIVVPAPFLGIETLVYKMTSTREIHVSCGSCNYIFTKPVVAREDFVDESLLKMARAFNLSVDSIPELERTILDFIEYTGFKVENG